MEVAIIAGAYALYLAAQLIAQYRGWKAAQSVDMEGAPEAEEGASVRAHSEENIEEELEDYVEKELSPREELILYFAALNGMTYKQLEQQCKDAGISLYLGKGKSRKHLNKEEMSDALKQQATHRMVQEVDG